jgi:hypothetical protein
MYLLKSDKKKTLMHDYVFYVRDASLKCQTCGSFSGMYYKSRFENDKIFFIWNCSQCGENSFLFIKYKELRQRMFSFFYSSGDKDNYYHLPWRLFRLVSEQPQLLKTETDRKEWKRLWLKLYKIYKHWGWWFRFRLNK